MKKKILLLLFMLPSLFAIAQNSGDDEVVYFDDYQVIGCNWGERNLKYYIQNTTNDLSTEACIDAIRASFATWSSISDFTFTQVSSSSNANIIISWDDNFSSDSMLACTGTSYNISTMLVNWATIRFNENVTWKLDGNNIDLIVVAVHEIGHALGLKHSDYANAIMYPFYHYARNLTADDICGLWSIYECPFSIIGSSTVYGSSEYYIDNVPVDSRVSVEWSLSNSEFDANHLQENTPSANMCTITSDDNHAMFNATLTARLYYNGDLLQTFTKDSISAPIIYFNGTYYNGQTTENILIPSPLYVLPGTMVTINSIKLIGATVIQDGGNCTPSILSLDAINGVLSVGMPSTSGAVVVVKVYCSDGSTNILPIIATTGENLMSLSQSDGALEVSVMPDYAIERFDGYEYCNIESPSNWKLEIRDAITGTKVQDILVSGNSYRIETLGFKKGLYIIRAIVGKEVLGEKVFIR